MSLIFLLKYMSQYILTSLILTALGTQDIINGIGTQILLKSMSMASCLITRTVKSFFNKKNLKSINNIKMLMTEVDIKAEMDVLKLYMEETRQDNPGIIKAWENLNSTINEIALQLEDVNKKVEKIESSYKINLWINGEPEFNSNYIELERLVNQFTRRLNLLVKLN